MIYITGDCHGDYRRFSKDIFPEQKEMNKDDFMIICGDFGYWLPSKEQDYWLKWLSDKPFTTLFVDGNHENFDGLTAMPPHLWHGGEIHKVTDSVFHLMRGQIFDLQGCRIFTFGGARSHDISGGILEQTDPGFKYQKKKLARMGRPYRINHVSWWAQEMPSEEEMAAGRDNLNRAGNEVDYIITHCCATSTQALFSFGEYRPDALTDYFESLRQQIRFKRWFFGHYHDNRQINSLEIMLYEEIIRIW